MLKVGKIYKLQSSGFEKILINSSETYEEIGIELEKFNFILLETNVKNTQLEKEHPDTKIFRIFYEGRIYFLQIAERFLFCDKKELYFIEFVQFG